MMRKLIFKIRKKMAIKKLIKEAMELVELFGETESDYKRICYYARLRCIASEIDTIAHTPYKLPERGGITVGVNEKI